MNAMNGETEDIERVNEAAKLLENIPGVTAVVRDSRRPLRIDITIWADEIPAGVSDVLEEFNAVLDDAEIVSDVPTDSGYGLRVTAYLAADFEYFGEFLTRIHGNSVVVTLSPEARDAAGVEEHEDVDVYARPGEFRVRSTDPND